MNKRAAILLLCVCVVVAGLLILGRSQEEDTSKIVAISMSQGLISNDEEGSDSVSNDTTKHGSLVLTAIKKDDHYEIRASGICGRNISCFGDLGKIGTAQSLNEAIELYGMIEWKQDRILIGGLGGVQYEMPIAKWLDLALENLANKGELATPSRAENF